MTWGKTFHRVDVESYEYEVELVEWTGKPNSAIIRTDDEDVGRNSHVYFIDDKYTSDHVYKFQVKRQIVKEDKPDAIIDTVNIDKLSINMNEQYDYYMVRGHPYSRENFSAEVFEKE